MTTGWTWRYDRYDPAREPLVEALCTPGNGRCTTRGSAPGWCAADTVHYPGTYLAGCYDRLTSTVAGQQVENEDLEVRLRILPGRPAIRVSASPEGPLAVVLPGGRRVAVAPGQERWFRL